MIKLEEFKYSKVIFNKSDPWDLRSLKYEVLLESVHSPAGLKTCTIHIAPYLAELSFNYILELTDTQKR